MPTRNNTVSGSSESYEFNDSQISRNHKLSSVNSQESSLDPVLLHQLEQMQQERLKFDEEFAQLQDPKSSTGRIMYVFTQRELRQFRLHRLYREAFVLNTAYIRAIERIAKGEIIRNPTAWLRGTIYRIIRELSRQEQKTCSFDESISGIQLLAVSAEELNDDFMTLRMAYQLLTPKDQRLLHLKIVEERSWKEIREALAAEGHGEYTEVTLRKQKERALTRLRRKYHAIKPPDFSK